MRVKLAWIVALALWAAPPAWFLATLPPIDGVKSAARYAAGPALTHARRQVDLTAVPVRGGSTPVGRARHEHQARAKLARADAVPERRNNASSGRAHAGRPAGGDARGVSAPTRRHTGVHTGTPRRTAPRPALPTAPKPEAQRGRAPDHDAAGHDAPGPATATGPVAPPADADVDDPAHDPEPDADDDSPDHSGSDDHSDSSGSGSSGGSDSGSGSSGPSGG